MNQKTNFVTVQWKMPLDKCTEDIRLTLMRNVEELKALLRKYPTAGMTILGEDIDYEIVIPDVIRSISTLRAKLDEVDNALDSGVSALVGYYNHLQEMSAPTEETPTETVEMQEEFPEDENATETVEMQEEFPEDENATETE